MADRFDLTGKVAVVTGGSRGMGLEMCKAFANAGARVAVAAEIQAESGQECHGFGYHAGEWDASDRLAEFAYKKFGKVDVLVNNAGMSPLYDKLTNVTEALYEKILQVNMRGPFRLSTLIGERMAEGDGGSIIMVSSTAAVQPTPTELPYGMAKAGINAFTLGLARAYCPKVRVNCIMPGPFLTDIAKAWDMDAFNERARTSIPLRRGGQAEEIVGAALYFASDASSFTTGAILKIDGGSAYPAA